LFNFGGEVNICYRMTNAHDRSKCTTNKTHWHKLVSQEGICLSIKMTYASLVFAKTHKIMFDVRRFELFKFFQKGGLWSAVIKVMPNHFDIVPFRITAFLA